MVPPWVPGGRDTGHRITPAAAGLGIQVPADGRPGVRAGSLGAAGLAEATARVFLLLNSSVVSNSL